MNVSAQQIPSQQLSEARMPRGDELVFVVIHSGVYGRWGGDVFTYAEIHTYAVVPRYLTQYLMLDGSHLCTPTWLCLI